MVMIHVCILFFLVFFFKKFSRNKLSSFVFLVKFNQMGRWAISFFVFVKKKTKQAIPFKMECMSYVHYINNDSLNMKIKKSFVSLQRLIRIHFDYLFIVKKKTISILPFRYNFFIVS